MSDLYAGLETGSLDALGADFAETPADDTQNYGLDGSVQPDHEEAVTTPGDEESPAGEPSVDEQGAPEVADVPGGKPAEAFKAYRQEIATLKAQNAQMLQQMQAFQQQQAQQQQLAEQARIQEELAELATYDPEQASAKLQQYQQMVAARAQAQLVESRVTLSESYARQKYADYDAVIDAVKALGSAVNLQAFLAEPDPAEAAYQFGRRLMGPSPETTAAQQQAIAQRLTPQKPTAPKHVGAIPAAASAQPDPELDSYTGISRQKLAQMSPEQLDSWYKRALGG
jgi:hypothetical protein